jgi:hypothetical protein
MLVDVGPCRDRRMPSLRLGGEHFGDHLVIDVGVVVGDVAGGAVAEAVAAQDRSRRMAVWWPCRSPCGVRPGEPAAPTSTRPTAPPSPGGCRSSAPEYRGTGHASSALSRAASGGRGGVSPGECGISAHAFTVSQGADNMSQVGPLALRTSQTGGSGFGWPLGGVMPLAQPGWAGSRRRYGAAGSRPLVLVRRRLAGEGQSKGQLVGRVRH